MIFSDCCGISFSPESSPSSFTFNQGAWLRWLPAVGSRGVEKATRAAGKLGQG